MSKHGDMQELLKLAYAVGVTGRDLFLWEVAQEAVDAEYADRFYHRQMHEPSELRDMVDLHGEIMTERDFAMGLQEDMATLVEQCGVPEQSPDEPRRLELLWCLVGRDTYAHELEGV